MMNEIICIYKTYDSTEADLIRAEFEALGIPCYLRSDNASGVLPQLNMISGIGLMIHQEDESLAREILDQRSSAS